MEVTTAQKAALEKSDAAWTRPSDDLIKAWEVAGGYRSNYGHWESKTSLHGRTVPVTAYNEATGFFEAYDYIKDITEREAREIMSYHETRRNCDRSRNFSESGMRVYLRTRHSYASPYWQLFCACWQLRVCDIDFSAPNQVYGMFADCWELRKIFGKINLYAVDFKKYDKLFYCCYKLESVELYGIKYDLDLQHSPLFDLPSFRYMIAQALNTSVITVKVHPDVYARITDETNTEWHQLLIDATAKNIQFATV